MKKIKISVFISLLSLSALLTGCTVAGTGNGTATNTPGASVPVSASPSPSLSPSPSEEPAPSERPDEMEITFEIEGTQETMTLQKYTGENFSMYIDETNFTAQESGREVKFTLTGNDAETYPEVSITVSYEQGTSSEEKADSLSKDAAYTFEGEQELGGNAALRYHAKPEADAQGDSPVQDIYLINVEDGFFTITVTNYLEAEEGWGARMSAMINTFQAD